jgi:hypothetical protein
MWVRPGVYLRVEYLKGASLVNYDRKSFIGLAPGWCLYKCQLIALPACRVWWLCTISANALTYQYAQSLIRYSCNEANNPWR